MYCSLESCELMELRCLCVCFRLCVVPWTSLKNYHMQPLQQINNAVRDFFLRKYKAFGRNEFLIFFQLWQRNHILFKSQYKAFGRNGWFLKIITAKSVDDMIINFLLFLAKWSKDIFSSFSSVNHFQKGSYDYVLNRYEKNWEIVTTGHLQRSLIKKRVWK